VTEASTAHAAPIRTLIVDDEALARRGIRQLLAVHPDMSVVAECGNGREALAALSAHSPALMFLDVQMPELDGLEMMREAAAAYGHAALPVTVFLTAYEDFALAAFDVDATDYLVKPVSEERFESTMQRVRRRLASPADHRAAHLPIARGAAHLIVATSRGQRVVPLDDIEWIGADDYYAAVHANGRRHLLRESLASLETRLDPSRFVRVHRGAMVNVTRIREVRTTDGDTVAILHDGTRIPVSRRRRPALVGALRAASQH
jgi:two-component system LytT family response regulator